MIQPVSINTPQSLIPKGFSYTLTAFEPKPRVSTSKIYQNIESSIFLLVQKQIESLKNIYIFQNPEEIIQFLLSNKDLIEILLEAHKYIFKIFREVPIYLELHHDPEEYFECLFIIIKTNLPIEVALDRLDKFDEEYWLYIDDTISNILEVTVRPL